MDKMLYCHLVWANRRYMLWEVMATSSAVEARWRAPRKLPTLDYPNELFKSNKKLC
jgi:hypothetical protein